MEIGHILVILGILSFVAEIFTTGFIMGSIGIGFFFTAIGNYLGLAASWQIILFAPGVGLSYFLIRPVMVKYGYRKSHVQTNRDALAGKKGIVTEEINTTNDTGRVRIDGDDWKAVTDGNDTIPLGTTVEVLAIDSIILIVKPLN